MKCPKCEKVMTKLYRHYNQSYDSQWVAVFHWCSNCDKLEKINQRG